MGHALGTSVKLGPENENNAGKLLASKGLMGKTGLYSGVCINKFIVFMCILDVIYDVCDKLVRKKKRIRIGIHICIV